MADGMLALSWNNHSSTFCHMLSQIRLKDRYTDATVACEGKFYPVHRIVLSTCSKYFEEMFEMTAAGKHPIVLLQDVRRYELEALLSYMYAGVVSVAQKDLARLIKIAELLQVKGLAVPDELPGEKKSASGHSERTSSGSGHPKLSHPLDHGEGRVSPSRKRRRREELGSSPKARSQPSSSSKNVYNQDNDDDILEIKREPENNPENLDLVPLNDSSCGVPSVDGGGGDGRQIHVPSPERLSEQQHNSRVPSRRGDKDDDNEMMSIKEEVLDDPGDPQGDSVKPELPRYGPSSSTVDESLDVPPDSQADYSQTSLEEELPHPLSDSGAEALAGPSGLHEWLSGGDMSAGLPSVDNYGEGNPPTSDQPQSQQMGLSLRGRVYSTGLSCALRRRGPKMHHCPHCLYSTPMKDRWRAHVRRHTGERPFACPHCKATFAHQGTLVNHIHTHEGNTPFVCPECSKEFSRRDYMKKHILSVHGTN